MGSIKQEIFEFPAGKIEKGKVLSNSQKRALRKQGILRRVGVNWESYSYPSLFRRKDIPVLRKNLIREGEQNTSLENVSI